MKTYRIFAFLTLIVLLTSCKCKKNATNAQNFEIINPTYKIYDLSGERGYFVNFKLKDLNAAPEAVIINGVKKKIAVNERSGNTFSINVIAQSRKIMDFKAESSSLSNGIIFKTDSEEIHQPVNFILKN